MPEGDIDHYRATLETWGSAGLGKGAFGSQGRVLRIVSPQDFPKSKNTKSRVLRPTPPVNRPDLSSRVFAEEEHLSEVVTKRSSSFKNICKVQIEMTVHYLTSLFPSQSRNILSYMMEYLSVVRGSGNSRSPLETRLLKVNAENEELRKRCLGLVERNRILQATASAHVVGKVELELTELSEKQAAEVRQNELLLRVRRFCETAQTRGELLLLACNTIPVLLNCADCFLFVMDEDHDKCFGFSSVSENGKGLEIDLELCPNLLRCFCSGEVVRVNGKRVNPVVDEKFGVETRTLVNFPVSQDAGSQVVAVVQVINKKGGDQGECAGSAILGSDTFGSHELSLLGKISKSLLAPLSRFRFNEWVKQNASLGCIVENLFEVSQVAARDLRGDKWKWLGLLADELAKMLGAQGAGFYLVDPRDETCAFLPTGESSLMREALSFSFDKGLVGRTASSCVSASFPDLQREKRFLPTVDWRFEFDARDMTCWPVHSLKDPDLVIAVLQVANLRRAWTKKDELFLQTVWTQIVEVLEMNLLRGSFSTFCTQQAARSEILRVLRAGVDVDQTLTAVLDVLKPAMNASHATYMLYNPALDKLETAPKPGLTTKDRLPMTGLLGNCIKSKLPINVSGAFDHPLFVKSVDAYATPSLHRTHMDIVAAPLLGADHQSVLGVLAVYRVRKTITGNAFSDNDAGFLMGISADLSPTVLALESLKKTTKRNLARQRNHHFLSSFSADLQSLQREYGENYFGPMVEAVARMLNSEINADFFEVFFVWAAGEQPDVVQQTSETGLPHRDTDETLTNHLLVIPFYQDVLDGPAGSFQFEKACSCFTDQDEALAVDAVALLTQVFQ